MNGPDPAPGVVDASHGEVHVWKVTLDPPGPVLSRFDLTLNDDERKRRDRFRTETLRRRFLAGRGSLRAILGAYLRCPPENVALAYGVHGKPRLADPGDPAVEFNLAHSHDVALCAVTLGRAVGVDVEAVRPLDNSERIIERFFSPREQSDFLALPHPERLAAFFRGWSRKEAFLKATGTGLATRLDSFDVTLGPFAALLRVGEDPSEAPRWSLLDLDPGPGYAAAVAVRGGHFALKTWDGVPEP
ncbi:MAG: 4'-phosphopantetheinyl transferase superfamily protein [Planctomycetia bacterium]|nr:4'-phosphopantetheinyl transferase superfamily protein [Planctomycetia bacterium]